jgi:ribosomal protein S18 acetylase RimI-like enzyme
MSVRRATGADLAVIEELWRAFADELPPPSHLDVDFDAEIEQIREIVGEGLGFVAEEDGGEVVGFVLARRPSTRFARLTDIFVRPEHRRRGIAQSLVSELVETLAADGTEVLGLEVGADNETARAVYGRWGFEAELLTMSVPLGSLQRRISGGAGEETFGSIHVQTDDLDAVVRALEIYVPRLPGRSRGSVASPPRNGYVAVYDDACDRDPETLRRLARSVSNRTGFVVVTLGIEGGAVVRMILFDRGGIVDEYASVPEFHEALPPGEVVALSANPVVIERYTGADREAVRAATPTAAVARDLPPAQELLARLADVLRLEGALHGWAGAAGIEGAVRLERG